MTHTLAAEVWTMADTRKRRACALIGCIAEPAASVRERPDGDAVVFEVVTGIPEGPGPFASHGHAVRLTLRPAPPV